MQQWTYLTRQFRPSDWGDQPGQSGLERFLSEWGRQGWELVGLYDQGGETVAVFKQPGS